METESAGQRLVRLRGEWTQATLAEKAGVDQTVISKVEKGKAGMSPELAQRLAPHFGVTAGYLLFGEENPELLSYRSTVLREAAAVLEQMAGATPPAARDDETILAESRKPGYPKPAPAVPAKARSGRR